MCGIVAIVAQTGVNQDIYEALTVLQHRGQDAAGIMTHHNNQFFLRKAPGFVRDALRETEHLLELIGNMGIGHVRYPTAGNYSIAQAQPLYVNSPLGLALAHNGNLTNSEQLKKELYESELRHINSDSDSEVILNIFAQALGQAIKNKHELPQAIQYASKQVFLRCKGAYSVVIMIAGYGIVAFRDPAGIRPLVLGKQTDEQKNNYCIASESAVFNIIGYELLRDVRPGEVIIIQEDSTLHAYQILADVQYSPCLFEYIYFARPDSIMNEISVYDCRIQMGKLLAEQIQQEWRQHKIDVVIPVPDTSRESALSLANQLGLPYREGLVKNRYIGRTFIMPGQSNRKKSVRRKLNTIQSEFKDKNVLLVDDSIVRGTTSREIVLMAKEAGANQVYFASIAPQIKYQNVYGIDMPTREELLCFQFTDDLLSKQLNVEGLIFLDLAKLKFMLLEKNSDFHSLETSIFDGNYLPGHVTQEYLRQLSQKRPLTRRENTNSISSLQTMVQM